ncbi:MAG TPA: toll/interleukin-1 receptor domain-containing protein [Ktedonobacteraceae bacterium]
MTILRVFVSHALSSGTQNEDQFTIRLVNDLRAAGAEVVVDEISSVNDDFAQSLNQALPNCHWLMLVQTPAALHSPRVQLAVNTALNLVVQRRMQGVLRVITEPYSSGEVPSTWTTLKQFDASQDYPRALARVLLALGLVGQPRLPQSPAPHASPQQSSIGDRPVPLSSISKTKKSDAPHPVQIDRPLSPPALPTSTRRRLLLWSALLFTVLLVLVLASVMIVVNKIKLNTFAPHHVAAVSIQFSPQTQLINTVFQIEALPSLQNVDVNKSAIPARTLNINQSASQSGPTTGQVSCIFPPLVVSKVSVLVMSIR